MGNIAFSLIAGIAGFLIAEIFAGKEAGQTGRLKSVKIKYRDTIIHIHHWLYSIVGAFLLHEFYSPVNPAVFFLLGMAVQGFTYSDFYRVIYKHEPDSWNNWPQ